MTTKARRALALIRESIDGDRYSLTLHFSRRMEERGLFWPDVQAIINDPSAVETQGLDKWQRAKWLIRGELANDDAIAIVCAIEIDESGTEFITIFWED